MTDHTEEHGSIRSADRRLASVSASEQETANAGARLGETLRGGEVLLLYGDLGAGKTAFVRGLARGLGGSPDEVSSPTFTLVQEYRGRLTLYHVDLYRLKPEEIDDLGLDELVAPDSVVAIEWADRWPARPGGMAVRLEEAGEGMRRIVIQPAPS